MSAGYCEKCSGRGNPFPGGCIECGRLQPDIRSAPPEQSKPREWWVWFAASHWYCKEYQPIKDMRPTPNEHWTPVHVIEKSAYDRVVQEIGQMDAYSNQHREYMATQAERIAELERERDAYALAMTLALREGIFPNKHRVMKEIEDLVKEFRK